MSTDMRERLGQAAYDGFQSRTISEHRIAWEEQHPFIRERYCQEAEAVLREWQRLNEEKKKEDKRA